MSIIRTPNPRYDGTTAGVTFVAGTAVVDDEYLRRLLVRDYGYFEEISEQGESPAEEQPEPALKPRRPRAKTSAK